MIVWSYWKKRRTLPREGLTDSRDAVSEVTEDSRTVDSWTNDQLTIHHSLLTIHHSLLTIHH